MQLDRLLDQNNIFCTLETLPLDLEDHVQQCNMAENQTGKVYITGYMYNKQSLFSHQHLHHSLFPLPLHRMP